MRRACWWNEPSRALVGTDLKKMKLLDFASTKQTIFCFWARGPTKSKVGYYRALSFFRILRTRNSEPQDFEHHLTLGLPIKNCRQSGFLHLLRPSSQPSDVIFENI